MELWIFISLGMNMGSGEGRGELGRHQARAAGGDWEWGRLGRDA